MRTLTNKLLYAKGKIVLTENDVVKAVSKYLENKGYEIVQTLTTNETGVDIIAIAANGKHCYVEAKGATSSKPGSSNYGKEFNKSQVKTHVGVALVAAFKKLNEFPHSESIIALPNNANHRSIIDEMKLPIQKSGVKVLLVKENGEVNAYI